METRADLDKKSCDTPLPSGPNLEQKLQLSEPKNYLLIQ